MKHLHIRCAACLLAIGLLQIGCDHSASSVAPPPAGSAEKHDHDHDHDHDHHHQHSVEPLQGGKLVEIGHNHYGSGATHYHAEIMPVVDGKVVFHLLSQAANGKSEPAQVKAKTLLAYIDPLDRDVAQPFEITFTAEPNSGGSRFVATIPNPIKDCTRLSVVVPKIELGGDRQTFSFEASPGAPLVPSSKTVTETSP